MPGDDTKLFKELVPAEYHDRGYLKDILAMPQGPEALTAVLKKLDGAETLIGRKIGIPGTDAKPEEVEKFYSSLRPEKEDDYEIKGLNDNADPEFIKALRGAFHHAGNSKVQAQRFLEKLLPVFEAQATKHADNKKKADDAFDALAKTALGEDNKAVMAQVRKEIEERCPAEMKPHLDRLNDENMVIMASVIQSIRKQYIPEDQLDPKKALGGSGSQDDLQAEGRNLMASEAYTNFQHPDHDKTRKRVDEIYDRLGKLAAAGQT